MSDWRALSTRFRDVAQRRAAQQVIELRLADDRDNDACRLLMRFMWQLAMPYTEVTPAALRAGVSADAMAWIDRLLDATEQGHEAIDAWIEAAEAGLPIIEDRGFAARAGQPP
ncbi:MAG TPA: hypothetical protein PKA64_25910 [Myxococcota bacterium]|nr:hypothetical protein [Myxococcota bacterium]